VLVSIRGPRRRPGPWPGRAAGAATPWFGTREGPTRWQRTRSPRHCSPACWCLQMPAGRLVRRITCRPGGSLRTRRDGGARRVASLTHGCSRAGRCMCCRPLVAISAAGWLPSWSTAHGSVRSGISRPETSSPVDNPVGHHSRPIPGVFLACWLVGRCVCVVQFPVLTGLLALAVALLRRGSTTVMARPWSWIGPWLPRMGTGLGAVVESGLGGNRLGRQRAPFVWVLTSASWTPMEPERASPGRRPHQRR
jgi:hypothetical protein